jgi:hypothetical protein
MFTRKQAKQHLRQLGWSYRSVAPELGVTYVHLALVLGGQRESRRLMEAIEVLPPRPGPGWNLRMPIQGTTSPSAESRLSVEIAQ